MSARSKSVNLGLVLASLVVSVVLIEILLRLFTPFEIRLLDSEIILPYYKRYEITVDGARKLEPYIVHRKNALGFRGPNPPQEFEGHLTIVAIGGITTECFVLGDGKAWPAVFGQRLGRSLDRVWVNNTGLNGHTTFGHIQLLRQHILKLRPDVLVFLVGLNEIPFADNTARFDTRLTTDVRPAAENLFVRLRRAAARQTYLGALLLNIYRSSRAAREGFGDRTELDLTSLATANTSMAEIEAVLSEHESARYNGYAERVQKLIDMSRAAGTEPVFLTQPTLHGPGIDPVTGIDLSLIVGGWAGNGKGNWYLLQAYNTVLKRVGAANDVLVIDLASKQPKSSELYYDLWHFTNAGSLKVAEIIHAELCPFLAARFPAHARASCDI